MREMRRRHGWLVRGPPTPILHPNSSPGRDRPRPVGHAHAAALVDGYQLAFIVGASAVIAGIVVAATLLRTPRQPEPVADSADAAGEPADLATQPA